MAFFSDPTIKANIDKLKKNKSPIVNTTTLLKNMLHMQIGNIVVFNKEYNKFMCYKPESDIINDNKLIVLGIVLGYDKSYNITVLMLNSLTKEPVKIPFDYIAHSTYIPVYIMKLFDRYKKAYRKQCPPYKKVKKINWQIINYNDLEKLTTDEDLKKSLELLLAEDKYSDFLEKLKNNKIYINYNGQLMTWRRQESKTDKNIEAPLMTGAHFFVTAVINLI